MNNTVVTAIISGLFLIISAAWTLHATSKQARQAESTQATVDRDRLGIESWQKFADDQKKRADEQEQRSNLMRDQIDELRHRIEGLEAEVQSQRMWRRLATDYISHLIEVLSQAGVQVPLPPEGLDLTT